MALSGKTWSRPTIYVTNDGGIHWKKQFAFSATVYMSLLDMISAQDGWAVISSTLYRTSDGGAHWTAVALPAHDVRDHFDFTSATCGWVTVEGSATSTPARVLATNDGSHFHTILISQNGIGDVTVNARGSGEVLEGGTGATLQFGPVLRTSDDGRTWSVITTTAVLTKGGAFGYTGGMAFNGSTGWIGTNNGSQGFEPIGLLVTSDGGIAWHAVAAKLGWVIQKIAMTGPGQGWILASGLPGNSFLARTTDNGKHW